MTSARPDLAALRRTLEASAHAAYIQRCNAMYGDVGYALSASDIDSLQRQGNTAEDWSSVRKLHRDVPIDASRVHDCEFLGAVVLGRFDRHVAISEDQIGGDVVTLPSGCYRSTLRNAVVNDNALVRDTTIVSGTIVDSFASVVGCGRVLGGRSQCEGMTLHVGVEVGGRDVRVFAEMPFEVAAYVATHRDDSTLLREYDALVDDYVTSTQTPHTIIAPHARVSHCANVHASFIGSYAVVDDADVRHITVLSTKTERTSITSKSVVRKAIVQWNSTVESNAFVENAVLCDTSHVERHGIVMSSIIGSNTGVAEGEITSCLVGPFVGFHHHALLIASVWPEGKGNVGYGANVGSNHTLKAPDQELLPGEGVFYGLGCCVKFPSNFHKAPYAVIATGVSTLPQSVEMPFALINSPGHNIPQLSPAINEISPAWVLKHSVFTVLRNEMKFATRNKSKRTRIEASIFTHDNVQYMIAARNRLQEAAGKGKIHLAGSGEIVYTDAQVPGLGKNYMRESTRLEAIEAYTFFIELYALEQGLLTALEQRRQSQVSLIRDITATSPALQVLHHELPGDLRIVDALEDLVARRRRIVADAIKGKKRDDARGKRIIADYALVHSAVESEAAVAYGKRLADDIQRRVSQFIPKL